MSVAAPRATAQDRAASALRDAILDGTLAPGDRVNQELWAERVGVSMIPVREALRALAGEGLVTYRPRRGYAVTELDPEELEEVYHLRAMLEREALRRGIPRADERSLAALRTAASDCRRAARRGDVGAQLAANRRFHDVLHALAGSKQLTRLIDLLWDSTEAYRALYYALPGEAAEANAAHAAIVDAVAARDVDRTIRLQDEHRERALAGLRGALTAGRSAA